jgi:hypothetical protein
MACISTVLIGVSTMSDEMNSGRVQSPLARPQEIWNQPGFATCARGIREVVEGQSSLARETTGGTEKQRAKSKRQPAPITGSAAS